jgi:cell division protein FtsW (lipid II flippase)
VLRKKVKTISVYNLGLKFFVLFLLGLQLLDGASVEYYDGVESDKSKFLEWTMTATVISMFISIGLDSYKYEFVYVDVS